MSKDKYRSIYNFTPNRGCCVNYPANILQHIQYSPKIMHAQEVAQEVLVPQEHASGEKKLNCALSTRSCKKLRVLPQTKNIRRTLQQVALPAIDRFRTMCTANVYGKMQF